MSGKGDDRRPLSVDEQTFSANWDRVFAAKRNYYASIREKNYADSLRLEGITGARLGADTDSKPANDGSIPSAPAIYVNADTGEQVTEDWWPGDEINFDLRAGKQS